MIIKKNILYIKDGEIIHYDTGNQYRVIESKFISCKIIDAELSYAIQHSANYVQLASYIQRIQKQLGVRK